MSVRIIESDSGTKKMAREALKKYDKKIDETMRRKLDEVWDKILWDAIMECPIVTGTLASTIRIVEGAFGGMGGSHVVGRMIFDKSIIAGDETIINPRTGQPCIYAQWVHDGYVHKGGKLMPAQPFLEIAIDKNYAELEKAIEDSMKEMEREFGD